MDFSIFLTTHNPDIINQYQQGENTLGSKVEFHQGKSIEKEFDLAIIGVKESRGSSISSVKESPDYVREHLYGLFSDSKSKIIDLGNIIQGETLHDTLYALSEMVQELVKKDIIPVVIGGSQELTLGIYKAYEKLEQVVNLTTIDRKIDFQHINETNNNSYLK